jgi:hypothetical protein
MGGCQGLCPIFFRRYSFRFDLIYAPDYDADPEVLPEGTKMGNITGWAVLELSHRRP